MTSLRMKTESLILNVEHILLSFSPFFLKAGEILGSVTLS